MGRYDALHFYSKGFLTRYTTLYPAVTTLPAAASRDALAHATQYAPQSICTIRATAADAVDKTKSVPVTTSCDIHRLTAN